MFTRLKTSPGLRKGTMRRKTKLCAMLFLTGILSFSLYGEVLDHNVLPYKKNLKEKILDGEIFSESNVLSSTIDVNGKKTENQELHFTIAGLHPKSCEYALKKLSLYENYSSFLDFVKTSQYDKKIGEINFMLSHPLLPYNMRLIFKLPRIDKVGVYPFVFEQGILNNLKGNIYAINHKNRCLFFTKADWSGPHTGFPNLIFEFFSQTLAKMSMERLFRLSNTLSH
jgi:hypothetical protein